MIKAKETPLIQSEKKKKPLLTLLFVYILILCIYVISSFLKNSFT